MTQRCEEMLHPVMPISPQAGGACRGTADCAAALADALAGRGQVTVVAECYPGVDQQEVLDLLRPLGLIPSCTLTTAPWTPNRWTPPWRAT